MNPDVEAPEFAPLLGRRESYFAFRRYSGFSPRRNARQATQNALDSKKGHGLVSLLVGLDGSCILAGYMINLYTCEQRCNGIQSKAASHALGTLGNVSFAFSCLFMAELVFSIWAFGAQYFRSWFRVFDATVIIGNLVVDTLLRGVTKDAASLAVILRLWRLYKIGKEVSGGAAGLMEVLNGRIEVLEKENHRLRTQLTSLSPELDY